MNSLVCWVDKGLTDQNVSSSVICSIGVVCLSGKQCCALFVVRVKGERCVILRLSKWQYCLMTILTTSVIYEGTSDSKMKQFAHDRWSVFIENILMNQAHFAICIFSVIFLTIYILRTYIIENISVRKYFSNFTVYGLKPFTVDIFIDILFCVKRLNPFTRKRWPY